MYIYVYIFVYVYIFINFVYIHMTGSNNINTHNLQPVSCFHNRQALMKLYEDSFIEHVKPDDCESMTLVVAYIC